MLKRARILLAAVAALGLAGALPCELLASAPAKSCCQSSCPLDKPGAGPSTCCREASPADASAPVAAPHPVQAVLAAVPVPADTAAADLSSLEPAPSGPSPHLRSHSGLSPPSLA